MDTRAIVGTLTCLDENNEENMKKRLKEIDEILNNDASQDKPALVKEYVDILFALAKKERNKEIPKFTNEQLKPCIDKFKGNWIKQLNKNMLLMVDDYLTRYVKNGMRDILLVHENKSVELPNFLGYPLNSKMRSGKRYIYGPKVSLDHFFGNYVATINANCIVYFANTRESLILLHETTRNNFNTGLQNASTQSKYEYAAKLFFPPIFLAITDINSELQDPDTIAKLSVPILHSFYISGEFKENELNMDWELLIKTQLVPCYEMLAQATGLIEKAALTFKDSSTNTNENNIVNNSANTSSYTNGENHINSYSAYKPF